MKKILGIIAEYNPFHLGHKYQIEKAKKISGADYIICLISGAFVQRGEPAIFSSLDRAKMALENGINAVFEMPTYFSTSSAESFAFYGVDFFSKLGVDYLSFGAESATRDDLALIVDILDKESTDFKFTLAGELKKGMSYPKAREEAILKEINKYKLYNKADYKKLLDSPNNILAIEYMKAIKKIKSNLEPLIIKRTSDNYNKYDIEENNFASATAIRKRIIEAYQTESNYENIKDFVPNSVFSDILNLKPLSNNDILPYINLELEKYSYKNEDLSVFLDINKELSNRIINTFLGTLSYEDFINILKSKQYTYTRLSRALSHILLDIKKDKFDILNKKGATYAKLLGFNKKDGELLSILKEKSKIPIITKEKDAKRLEELSYNLYKHNEFNNKIYNSIYYYKYKEDIKKVKNNLFILE